MEVSEIGLAKQIDNPFDKCRTIWVFELRVSHDVKVCCDSGGVIPMLQLSAGQEET